MIAVLKVLHRSIVIEFYKQNAAFFGLILLVFFGFIRGNEHLEIGSFLVSNPSTLFFLYLVWLLYTGKVVLFLSPTIRKQENSFLEPFLLFNSKTKVIGAMSVALALLIPVIIYGGLLIFLSLSKQYFNSIASILGCLFILTLGLSFFIHQQLQGLPHEKQVFQIRLFKKINIPPQLFFVSNILRKEIVLLLLTKIYGCLLIIGTTALYRTDDFDLRLLTTGILLAAIGNVAIMHKYVWFSYRPMAFSQNLPLQFLTIISNQILSIMIILIPEILVLFRYYPLDMNVMDIIGLLSFVISLNYLMYAWMIRAQVELSDFIVVVFWIVVVTTFLILFSVHPLILGTFLLAFSMIIIYFRHHQYEHND